MHDSVEQDDDHRTIMQGVVRSNATDLSAAPMDLDGASESEEVYRSDLMQVRPTATAGLGVFATAHIPRGTRLICEAPLVVLSELGDPPDLYRLITALSGDKAASFWELAAYKRRREEVQWISGIRDDYTGPSAGFETHCDRVLHAWHIYETNRFTVRDAFGARDKLGMFPKSARLNHSCRPNVFHRHNARINRLTIHALVDIEPGTELCTSYIDIVHSTAERRRILTHWGFKCGCALCTARDSSSDHRRGKLEGMFAKAQRDAADREDEDHLEPWAYARALGDLEEVLRLMDEEALDECDTNAVALGLAVECAMRLGWKAMAVDWATKALEVEERCLGRDSREWDAAKERLVLATQMDATNNR